MTPSGIDLATFRFVAQCLNHNADLGTANKRSAVCWYSCGTEVKVKVKVKVTLEQDTKAQRWNRVIALLFF
jgi:hypothetical protein